MGLVRSSKVFTVLYNVHMYSAVSHVLNAMYHVSMSHGMKNLLNRNIKESVMFRFLHQCGKCSVEVEL